MILSILLCFIIHEGAHYITAYFFGESIRFQFSFGKLFGLPIVPRYIWNMPKSFSKLQKKIVAGAGFTIEILIGFILPFIVYKFGSMYLVVSLLHLGLYNCYAGESNDFSFFH